MDSRDNPEKNGVVIVRSKSTFHGAEGAAGGRGSGSGDFEQSVDDLSSQLPPNFNTSDFFNSKGELTGLSQFSDLTTPQGLDISSADESTVHEEINAKSSSNIEDSKCTCTSECSHRKNELCKGASKEFSISELVERKSARNTPESEEKRPFAELKTDTFDGVVHLLPKGKGKRKPHQLFQSIPRPPVSTQPTQVSLPSGPRPMFVRAPNFRLAAQNDKATTDKPYGSLTDAQLQNEVKKLYEMDRAEREVDETSSVSKAVATPSSVVRNLFPVDGQVAVPDNSRRPAPYLNDGLDEMLNYYMHKHKQKPAEPDSSKTEVVEPKCVKTKSYICGDEQERSQSHEERKIETKKQYSPLAKSPKSRVANLKELDQLWKDIQDTKAKMDADIQNRLKQQGEVPQLMKTVETKKFVAPVKPGGSRKARSVGKRKGKGGKKLPPSLTQQKPLSSASGAIGTTNATSSYASSFPVDPDKSEFSTLLELAQLSESELLDDLLNDDLADYALDEFEDPKDLDVEVENTAAVDSVVEQELSIALENIHLKEWLQSNPQHVVYYEKYLQEKYKKEFCENEITALQRQLLEAKEQIATLTGFLDIKTKSSNKYQSLWESLINKWKEHERSCSKQIDYLEKTNTELKTTIASQETKTKEYEEELNKTVGLVEEFKERMESMRADFEAELNEWKHKMGIAQKNLDVAKDNLVTETKEKESAKRALDDAKNSLERLELTNQETKTQLMQTESKLKFNDQEIKQLRTKNEEIKTEIEKERKEKQALESKLRAEMKEELRAEGARLHTYYNDKMQTILKQQSEKMLAAENELITVQETQNQALQLDHKKKIAQLTSQYEQQLDSMRHHHQQEIHKLKKDSEEKGKLISNVAKQLALFHQDAKVSNNNEAEILNNCNRSSVPSSGPSSSHSLSLNTKNKNSSPASFTIVKNSLGDMLDSNSDMKSAIASLIHAYKDKHNL